MPLKGDRCAIQETTVVVVMALMIVGTAMIAQKPEAPSASAILAIEQLAATQECADIA